MHHVIHLSRVAACFGMAIFAALPAQAELVTNGGFEADVLTQGGGTLRLQTIPTGWSNITAGQNVDLLGYGYAGSTASEGDKFLDLIGNITGVFPSGVRQSLSLLAGVTYRLTFDYNGGAPTTVTDPLLNWALGDLDSGSINVGALNVFSSNGRPVTAWVGFSRDITATTSGAYWLSFSTPYGDSGGPYVDNVSVTALTSTQNVPEPGSLALAGLALLGAAAARRRRA